MSAVEHMKTRHITSLKASSRGAKRSRVRRKGEFFVYTNMVSDIPIKDNQMVKSKENGQTSGAGATILGRRILYIFVSKEGDFSREAIKRGTAIIRGNTIPSTGGSFEIQGGQL